MKFPAAEFAAFRAKLTIPTREHGPIPFASLLGTQRHILMEIAKGLEDGIHDFVELKGGRQIGGTTLHDALTLFWLQRHHGMIGMKISDDDENMRYRRDIVRQMLDSLPKAYRWPVRQDNTGSLAWAKPSDSRLLFDYAGKRAGTGQKSATNLGRSRGLNLIDGDEVGLWVDQRAVSALKAAFAKENPLRLATWNGTAQGDNVFKEMCETAQKAVAQRFIFAAWWMHAGYMKARGTPEFDAYGTDERTEDERLWIAAVLRRYGHAITDEQLAWLRWQLVEEFYGDETLLAQEYGCLPEECFQVFGDKFFSVSALRRIRRELDTEPVEPLGLTFAWGKYWDQTEAKEVDPDDATFLVWEQPDPGGVLDETTKTFSPPGVYLVSAKSAYSDDPDQPEDVALVWRIYPDRMVQVAEYVTEDSDVLQFAWLLLYLCGAYRMTKLPTYLAFEVQGTGQGVLAEMNRMQNHGHGVSPTLRPRFRQLFDFAGSLNHYIWTKPDSFSGAPALQWQSTPARRPMIMHALRGQIAREQMVIRSPKFLNQLASIRRGEDGDNDRIAAGGIARDGRVVAAGIGAWFYLETIVAELSRQGVAPKERPRFAPTHVGEHLVQGFIQQRILSGYRGRR